jgi:hypothetical protein
MAKKKQKTKTVIKYVEKKVDDTDSKMNEQLRLLEERKRTLDTNKAMASQGKGFFGRLNVGFKSRVKQASLNAEINDIKGYQRAKRQQGLYREQAAALGEKRKLQAMREETAVTFDKVMGITPSKVNFKPISMEDIYK